MTVETTSATVEVSLHRGAPLAASPQTYETKTLEPLVLLLMLFGLLSPNRQTTEKPPKPNAHRAMNAGVVMVKTVGSATRPNPRIGAVLLTAVVLHKLLETDRKTLAINMQTHGKLS